MINTPVGHDCVRLLPGFGRNELIFIVVDQLNKKHADHWITSIKYQTIWSIARCGWSLVITNHNILNYNNINSLLLISGRQQCRLLQKLLKKLICKNTFAWQICNSQRTKIFVKWIFKLLQLLINFYNFVLNNC